MTGTASLPTGRAGEEGFADPAFLTAWTRHRAIYSYTLRAELVYQLLKLYRAKPTLAPTQPMEVLLVDEYQDLNLLAKSLQRFGLLWIAKHRDHGYGRRRSEHLLLQARSPRRDSTLQR